MERNSAAMEDLVNANSESNRTMLALVEQVRRETEARDRKIDVMERSQRQMRVLVYLVGVATVILLAVAVVNAFNIAQARDQQRQVRAIASQQPEIVERVKEYNLVGFYCIRTNPASEDPQGEAFLKCMQRLYPNGPTLLER